MKPRPDTLAVKLNDRSVGTITRLIDEALIFAFDPEYENDPNRPVLSLSLKTASGGLLMRRPKTASRLSPFFSNLLPEGHLRDYLARKLGINTQREFYLLAALGQDLPGAVTVEPMGEITHSDAEISAAQSSAAPLLRFSLAGVQLKFSAIAESKGTFTVPAGGQGGSWIVKLPSERHFGIPETEHSMLTLARLCDITVPEFKLIPTSQIGGLPSEFKDSVADSLAVKRFDRTDIGGRIHMEDFAQVYDIYPQDKYEQAGYGHVARVLWSEDGEASYSEFIRRLVFTVAIGNGDMHLKNWSLLYLDPQRPVLSPAYDFVPTIAYIEGDTLGLNLGGTKDFFDVTADKFRKVALQAKASEKLTARAVSDSVETIHEVWARHRFDLMLPADVRQQIDAHMAKLPLFKRTAISLEKKRFDSDLTPLLTNVVIASIDYDPIIPDDSMCLQAQNGRTTVVKAPNRMVPELIKEAAQQALLLELKEGPARAFVGEKLYRQWRKLQYITIDSHPRITKWSDFSEWKGHVEILTGKYSSQAWQKIISAYQRESIEEFDVINRDNSIRTFAAKVQKISEIERFAQDESTEASIELNIQSEKVILSSYEGISYLLSDFNLKELQEAVEITLKKHRWEIGLFSEPKRVVARKKAVVSKKKQRVNAMLEVEIIFQEDVRKTDLLIKVADVDGKLGKDINWHARQMRQDILEELPGPD